MKIIEALLMLAYLVFAIAIFAGVMAWLFFFPAVGVLYVTGYLR